MDTRQTDKKNATLDKMRKRWIQNCHQIASTYDMKFYLLSYLASPILFLVFKMMLNLIWKITLKVH